MLRNLCFLLLFIASSSFGQCQTIQSDDQHQFTVSVPLGWRVTKGEHGMKLSMSDSVIHILHVDVKDSPQQAAQVGVSESGENFSGIIPTSRGDALLGGEKASEFNFNAYDDRGIPFYLHVVASKSGWVFFAASTQAGFSSLRDTFQKIENSLMLTKNIPSAEPQSTQK